jgi:pyruvate formate-lyase/glycerol dehydratase family glycyl radical enzyme
MGWRYWGEPFAKTYMAMEGRHQALRIACGIKAAVEAMPIRLNPENAIIGAVMEKAIVTYSFGAGISVNYGLAEELLQAEMDDTVISEVKKIIEYFGKENTLNKIADTANEEEKKCGSKKVFWAGGWGGHTLLDYQSLLAMGTIGLKQKIRRRMEGTEKTSELEWLEALLVICEALERFAQRYAEAVSALLAVERDVDRIKELDEMDRICRKVPARPAQTWREALQAFWFAFVFDGVDSPGRFDQYMIPYLKYSLHSGEMSQDEAQILLEKLWLRFEEVRAWNLCIGGQTPDGNDATNELSYMILETAGKYGFQAPNLTMRCHKGTPEKLWSKAFEVIRTGIGMPALYNDEVVIRALQRFGIPLEDARDYAMNGCNQIDIQGKSYMGLEDGELNLLKCLELALNQGRCRLTGEMLGLDTGDPTRFESFEQVMAAYKQQVSYFTKMLTDVANKSQKVYAGHAPNPYRSLMVADCIDKIRDFREGGPRYNHGQILTEGIANTADSLAAIKKVVFEKRLLSMKELLEALDNNFEKDPGMRKLLQTQAGHFGNDDAEVDTICSDIVGHFFQELMLYRTFRGGVYGGGCSTFTRAPEWGSKVGATPDGRLARTPVADSSGAVQGRDVKGPTALLNSSAKVDHTLAQSGYVLNLKFEKSTFCREGAGSKFIGLIKTFFHKGGQQVQVNVTSREDLLAAREKPEDYKNLVVRVGGFSGYFVELDRALQEDVIARTSHGI